ncbi:hypothetical protein ACW95P_02860 [Candidatus Mycoplasma pogonae]
MNFSANYEILKGKYEVVKILSYILWAIIPLGWIFGLIGISGVSVVAVFAFILFAALAIIGITRIIFKIQIILKTSNLRVYSQSHYEYNSRLDSIRLFFILSFVLPFGTMIAIFSQKDSIYKIGQIYEQLQQSQRENEYESKNLENH